MAERLADAWETSLGERLPGATCSAVFAGRSGGRDVVLKVPGPDSEETAAWRCALAFAGRGGVDVLRHDARTGATLMPRVRPGFDLRDVPEAEALEACAALIAELRRAGAPLDGPSLAEQFAGPVPAGDELAAKAREIAAELLASSPRPVLLHGDLHHFNVLRDGTRWVAIDPKGVVGDPAFEVAAFMRNPLPRPPPAAGMRRRLEVFAERLGDPIERLWGWSFAQTVACALDSEGDPPSQTEAWRRAAAAIWEARP